MWLPCSSPYPYLGRILVHIAHWCPSFENKPLAPASTDAVLCSVLQLGGSIFLLPTTQTHQILSIRLCCCLNCRYVYSAKLPLTTTITLCHCLSGPVIHSAWRATSSVYVSLSLILVLQVGGDALELSVFATRQLNWLCDSTVRLVELLTIAGVHSPPPPPLSCRCQKLISNLRGACPCSWLAQNSHQGHARYLSCSGGTISPSGGAYLTWFHLHQPPWCLCCAYPRPRQLVT